MNVHPCKPVIWQRRTSGTFKYVCNNKLNENVTSLLGLSESNEEKKYYFLLRIFKLETKEKTVKKLLLEHSDVEMQLFFTQN